MEVPLWMHSIGEVRGTFRQRCLVDFWTSGKQSGGSWGVTGAQMVSRAMEKEDTSQGEGAE